jgi:NAD-dependent deacetylase
MPSNAPRKEHALIANWLKRTNSAVIFTGAGISTESGIPDFRSPGGVWSKYRTVYFDEFMRDAAARHEYWRQKSEGHADFANALPNAGHLVAARWEQAGFVRGVVTQNIDGLHQRAGSQQVLELHGTAREIACMDCGARYDADEMVGEFLETDVVPRCRNCPGGRLKHATVSFGQSLPAEVLEEATRWCRQSSLIFALGSSLVVHPAADLPRLTKQAGGRLVIINRDPTPLDAIADAVINAPIGETLRAIDAARKPGVAAPKSGLSP